MPAHSALYINLSEILKDCPRVAEAFNQAELPYSFGDAPLTLVYPEDLLHHLQNHIEDVYPELKNSPEWREVQNRLIDAARCPVDNLYINLEG